MRTRWLTRSLTRWTGKRCVCYHHTVDIQARWQCGRRVAGALSRALGDSACVCARVRVRVSGAYTLCCGRRSPRDVLMHSDSDGFVVEREAKYFFTCTYSTQSLSVSPSLTPLPLSVCLSHG